MRKGSFSSPLVLKVNKDLVPTDKQLTTRELFAEASLYAKGAIADPALKKEYQKKAKSGRTASFLCPVAKINFYPLGTIWVNRVAHMPQLCVIKLIDMTHPMNIMLAPGSLRMGTKGYQKPGRLLWVLYRTSTGLLQNHSVCMSSPRQVLDHSQAIPLQVVAHSVPTVYPFPAHWGALSNQTRLFFSNRAGRFYYSPIKTTIMATTASSKGINPGRIKNDPVFERTRENNAAFARAGKAAIGESVGS